MAAISTDEGTRIPESELDKLCHNCFNPLRSHEPWCIYSPEWTYPAEEIDEDGDWGVSLRTRGR